jgi:phosphatidylglycerol:prolipoprotein diacylglycerol transferase
VLAWLLIRWRRSGTPDAIVLGRYLIYAGTARFLIEFVRINPKVALGLTVAQLGTLVLIAGGVWLLTTGRSAARSTNRAESGRRRG